MNACERPTDFQTREESTVVAHMDLQAREEPTISAVAGTRQDVAAATDFQAREGPTGAADARMGLNLARPLPWR